MESKKNRSENWSQEEKALLLQCINEKKTLIDSKTNDIKILRERRTAWLEITDVFRANGYVRDVCRVKEQWRRMKCLAKKNVSVYERERKKTGGGSPPQKPSEIDYMIMDICPEDFVVDKSNYDSDGCARQKETVTLSTSVTTDEYDVQEMILDADTGLLLNVAQTADPIVQTSISPIPPPKSDNPKTNRKRKLSCYEEELLAIEKKRFSLDQNQKIEVHREVMHQLSLERKRKEEELKAAIFKRKREELEYSLLREKSEKNN